MEKNDELIREHKRLIKRLRSRKNLDKEADIQENELKKMKSLERFINMIDDESLRESVKEGVKCGKL